MRHLPDQISFSAEPDPPAMHVILRRNYRTGKIERQEIPMDTIKRTGSEVSMAKYDAMPKPYRLLVHDMNIEPVYAGWRSGMSVEQIRARRR